MNRRNLNDSHHLLHTRRSWESGRTTQALREQPSLIFRMPRVNHELIHEQTPPIALLGHYAALGVLGRYNPTFDPTKDIDNLCLAIERSTRSPKFHSLERDLGGLCIEGIQLQKPLIFDAIGNNTEVIV